MLQIPQFIMNTAKQLNSYEAMKLRRVKPSITVSVLLRPQHNHALQEQSCILQKHSRALQEQSCNIAGAQPHTSRTYPHIARAFSSYQRVRGRGAQDAPDALRHWHPTLLV